MRFFITGSAGFVGGNLGRFAARRGHSVLGVARRSQPEADWPGEHVAADVSQADLASAIHANMPDVVFHGAGSASVASSFAAPLDDFRAAVMGWANLLDGVRRSGTNPLIIFPSSAAVYGSPASLPVTEESPHAPISPYGYHKAACELLAKEYVSCFNLRILIVRIFSIFGASQRRLLVWELFQRAVGEDRAIWLQGSGNESRDYLHIDDLSSAIVHLCEPRSIADGRLNIVNIGRGCETSVKDIASIIRDAAAVEKDIQPRGEARQGDPQRWQADTAKLNGLIADWHPSDLDASVRLTVKSWLNEMTSASRSVTSTA